jgi:hypothetical protein
MHPKITLSEALNASIYVRDKIVYSQAEVKQ